MEVYFQPMKNYIHSVVKELNEAKMTKFVLEMEAEIMGKGENDGYHHFLPLQHCFQKLFP